MMESAQRSPFKSPALANWFPSPWSHLCPCFPRQSLWCLAMDKVKHISKRVTQFTEAILEHRDTPFPTCPVYIIRSYPTGIDTHAKAGYQTFSFRNLKLGAGTKPGSHQDRVASLTTLYRGPGILLWYLRCDNHFATHEKTRLRTKKRMLEDSICTSAESCRPTVGPSLPKTTHLSFFFLLLYFIYFFIYFY